MAGSLLGLWYRAWPFNKEVQEGGFRICEKHLRRRVIFALQALRGVAINIWDLIEARESGLVPAPRFRSKKELRADLTNPSRRFPLAKIKESDDNKLLRALLVTMN